MKNIRKKRPVAAEAIARLADSGKDVLRFFTNTGRMMGSIQRVNVDFALPMLEKLDHAAKRTEHQPASDYQDPGSPSAGSTLPGNFASSGFQTAIRIQLK